MRRSGDASTFWDLCQFGRPLRRTLLELLPGLGGIKQLCKAFVDADALIS